MDGKQEKVYAGRLEESFGKCPRCGSSDLDASDYDGDRVMSAKVTCSPCGLQWTELYRFYQAVNFEDTKK